jgi:hypothetical protein
VHEAAHPRIWQGLLYPLSLQEFPGGIWMVVIKGTSHNVLCNEEGTFVVFGCKEQAASAFDKIKEMREDYKKHGTLPIRVNL